MTGDSLFQQAEPLWPDLRRTNLLCSEALNDALGTRVVLVSETFQHTGSFKYRAALSAARASKAQRLITASSGNFGAALALAAKLTGKTATVVMPAQSASVKIAAVARHGATVDLIDTNVVTRSQRVVDLAVADPSAQVVSPYNDWQVICGNATLGLEVFASRREEVAALLGGEPDCLVSPVGGGGLASGLVLARNALFREVAIYGAEPALANDAAQSLRRGLLVQSDQEANTLCDGARTLSLGLLNFEILVEKRGLSGIVEVPEEQVVLALRLLFVAANLKVEPTAALSVASLLVAPEQFKNRKVLCVVSGGNVDPQLYARILTG